MDIKQKITDSIKEARRNGIVLVSEDWGSKSLGCACPLGCLFIQNEIPIEDHDDNIKKAAELLETDPEWIDNFYHGFDGMSPTYISTNNSSYIEAYHLGAELREQFEPLTYDDFMDNKYES